MARDKTRFRKLFGDRTAIIGMIHLQALPGAPEYGGSMGAVLDAALQDLAALESGGVHAIMIENFFDAPFFKDHVGAETVAAMTRVITEIRQKTTLPLGVNVLRNDGISALAIAAACDCQFVRVNQVSWAAVADQGILEGRAAELARFRRMLGSDTMIFADCLTKHAVPLAAQVMENVAADTWERGGVDAIIVSGTGTGKATSLDDVIAARQGAPDAPILIGSGVTAATISEFLPHVAGVLVGTSIKRDGVLENPVDASRVREIMQKVAHTV
jgi:uncharacterized protein